MIQSYKSESLKEEKYDTIIGSGIGGLTCQLFIQRRQKKFWCWNDTIRRGVYLHF